MRDVIALLGELVAIDSVNPSLVPGGAGETEIARFVADWATSHGLGVEMVGARSHRPSVLVTGGHAGPAPTSAGRTLMLCGHLDTVGVGGVSDPFVLRATGDRLHGRGAYDMKAGLAAALIACRDAHRSGVAGAVMVAAVADEEHASTGVREVLSHLGTDRLPDAAVVMEPTEMAIGVAHKGFVWVEITVTGRAAHGSRPQLGVDAIVRSGRVLTALGALDARLRQSSHPLLGSANIHASVIEGGSEMSTIPDRCVIGVERRTLPGETVGDVGSEIAQLLDTCRADDPVLEVSHRIVMERDPFAIEPGAALVRDVAGAAAAVGRTAPIAGMSYWADAAFIAAAGVPTVLYGPGGEGAHAAVEWVSRSDTEACAGVLGVLARSFCA